MSIPKLIRCLVVEPNHCPLHIPGTTSSSNLGSILHFDHISDMASIEKRDLSGIYFHASVLIGEGPEFPELSRKITALFPQTPIVGIIDSDQYLIHEEEVGKWADMVLLKEDLGETDLANAIVNVVAKKEGHHALSGHASETPSVCESTLEGSSYSRSLYEEIVESDPDLICRSLPDTTLTYVNKAYCDFFQRSRDELTGKRFSTFLSPEDLDIVIAEYCKLSPDNPRATYEHRIISPAGDTLWFQWSDKGIFNEKGNLVEVESVGRDVTREYHAEETIRQQKDRLGTLFEFSSDGIVFASSEYVIEDVNNAFCEIFGYTLEESLGKKLDQVVSEKKGNGSCQDERETIDMKKHFICGETCIRIGKNGREVPVSVSVFPFKKNADIKGICIIYRDLTLFRQKEEALKLSKTIIDNSPVIVFKWTNSEGWPVEYVSENIRTLGFDPQEMTAEGWLFNSIVHPEDLERIDREIEETRKIGSEVFEHQYRIILKNGEVKWVREKNRPEYDEDGKIGCFTGIILDDTERIQTQRELEKSIERLRMIFSQTIETLAETANKRDPYTASHQKRVARLALAIAREMGLETDRCEGLYLAAMVHDVGKISIPAEILSKPTKLTEVEMGVIRVHPESSYEILRKVDTPWPVAEIAYQHHERMDGSGYPRALKGDSILLEARILAVADVVEASASHRPYRPGLGIEKALEIIRDERGTRLDAEVVDACLKVFEKGFSLEDQQKFNPFE